MSNGFDRESGGCPPASKRSLRGKKPVELKVSALSQGEWNYLRGLFLADGRRKLGLQYYRKRKKTYPAYLIQLFFQGDELELARRVVWMLGRAGLNSRIDKDPREEMFTVSVLSKSLFAFLPDGHAIRGDVEARSRFFDENGLFTVEGGVPFLAGLIDGDGCCFAFLRLKRNGFRYVESSCRFSQTKFPFLIDYVERFMGSVLAPGKRAVSVHSDPHKGSFSRNPLKVLSFLRAGAGALLSAGIERFSWKIPRWLRLLESLRAWRRSYLTTPEVARLIGVHAATVRNWIRAGKLSRVMQRGRWSYVEADEVERLKAQLAGS